MVNVNDFFFGVAIGIGLVYLAFFIYWISKKNLLKKSGSGKQTV